MAGLGATFTRDHHVVPLGPKARVLAGNEIAIAVITGEPLERTGKIESMPFGDPSGESNVLPRPVGLASSGSLSSQRHESINTLFGYGHGERGGDSGHDRTGGEKS